VILDGDLGGGPGGLGVPVEACMVHCCHWPCRYQGRPAVPAPLHMFHPTGRDQAVRMWEVRTHRQRPLIIHTGTIPDPEDHVFETQVYPCPCGAEILPAVPPAFARRPA
jgi:hypothetical protein